ncbi:hypothetical protein U0070_009079, partial [Myodes glareolus]
PGLLSDIFLTLLNYHLSKIFIVVIIIIDLHLHSPIYFLLINLLFIDFCLSSVTTYKMITDFLKEKKTPLEGARHHEQTYVHWISDGIMDHWLCAFNKPIGYNCKSAFLWIL